MKITIVIDDATNGATVSYKQDKITEKKYMSLKKMS